MGPFTRIDNAIFDYAELVKPAGMLIYCYLAKLADETTRECWPSVADIQEKLGLAKGTVCTHLALLREHGLIEFREQEDDQRSRIYFLPPVPPLPASSAPKKKRRIGSDFEPISPIQADTQAQIGSKSEPVQKMDRSKSWTQIGSKSEPYKDPCTKTQSTVPSGREAAKAAPSSGPDSEENTRNRRKFSTDQALNIAVQKCRDHYLKRFRSAFPNRPTPTVTNAGKECLKQALKAIREADECDYGVAETEVMRLLELFLKDQDPFVERSGHDLSTFRHRLNALRQGRLNDGNGKQTGNRDRRNSGGSGGSGGPDREERDRRHQAEVERALAEANRRYAPRTDCAPC